MLPDLTFFLAVILGLMAFEAPYAVTADRAMPDLMGVLVCVIGAVWLARHAGRRAAGFVEAQEPTLAVAHLRWATLWPLMGWAVAIVVFGWPGLVQFFVPRETWILQHLVLLTPLLIMFGAGWAAEVPARRALIEQRGGIPLVRTPRDGVIMGLRRNAMLLVPLLIFTAVFEGIWLLGTWGVEPFATASRWMQHLPSAQLLLSIAILLLALPFVPRILTRLLKTQSLPEGATRSLLEQASRRIKLRYKDIVLWNTGGRMANAMVVGFTGGTRRIVVTDRLLQDLPRDELLAVFFHEAGHAKRFHLPLFLVLAFALMLCVSALAAPLAAIGISPVLLFIAQILIFWFVILGWVSRRFEREADTYGADHAALLDEAEVAGAGIDPLREGGSRMMRALDRVRRIAGRGHSHRHGSIDDRIAFIAAYAQDPGVRDQFRREQRSLVSVIILLLLIGIGATALRVPEELAAARIQMKVERAAQDYDEAFRLQADAATAAQARKLWMRSYDGFVAAAGTAAGDESDGARVQRVWAERNAGDVALQGLREPDRARPHYEQVLAFLPAISDQLGPGRGALLRFDAHMALGRIRAMAGELAAARTHLERIEFGAFQQAILEHKLSDNDVLRARVELLRATVASREGDHETARQRLAPLIAQERSSEMWIELRRNAQAELDWLDRAAD